MLGHWGRKLADGGLVAILTATSPPRLAHPEGGPELAGTNPLAIAIPSSEGRPLVADASMGAVTYGDVIAGLASEEELVPFGGEHAHKAFALAVGLQLLVDSLKEERLERRVGHYVGHGQTGENQDDDGDQQLEAKRHRLLGRHAKAVPDPSDRLDQRGALPVDLLAQIADVGLHDVPFPTEVVVPDVVQDL